ncbi:Predicted phosphatase [hydrothermal vent metagenome]|uniref:Predicted phosphatase n=1 Tax=hydrothermal vent metagenome TaxID=652676 RepID=A0A1W1EF81_9ZZZZ
MVNSSLTIANAINYVRKNLGFEPMDPNKILKMVNDHSINPAKTFYHAEAFDSDHEKWFSEYYSKNHKQELVLYDGIEDLLHTLKSEGHALALATNAYRVSTMESLTHLNILDYFDSIACYDDVANGKPSADMLYKILEELNYSNNRSIFVGDGPRDEMASKNANIPYIMVDWGFTEHINAVRTVPELKDKLLYFHEK